MRDDVGGYFLSERRIPGCAGMAGGPEQLSTGLANDAATIRYRTDNLPLRDRVSAWREYLSHFLIEIELKPDHPASDFDSVIVTRSVHDLQLLKMTFTAAQIIRKPSHGEGSDYFVLHVNFSGVVAVSSMSRQLTLNEGDAVLLDGARAFSIHRQGIGSSYIVRIPRRRMAQLVFLAETAVMGHPVSRARRGVERYL
jgi:hypothetical protein